MQKLKIVLTVLFATVVGAGVFFAPFEWNRLRSSTKVNRTTTLLDNPVVVLFSSSLDDAKFFHLPLYPTEGLMDKIQGGEVVVHSRNFGGVTSVFMLPTAGGVARITVSDSSGNLPLCLLVSRDSGSREVLFPKDQPGPPPAETCTQER